MFTIEVEDAERLVKIRWSGQVHADEMRRCLEEVSGRALKIPLVFRLLADMTDLDWMDLSCAPQIGALMDFCLSREVKHVVRVIPDPRKDIGLNILSSFHYRSQVQVTVCETLADALRQLAD
jgi:hypothetical protein